MFKRILAPVQTNAELITVGTGAITGVEIIDQSPLSTMGTTGEIIKLSLQTLIAVAAVFKYFRENKRKKREKDEQ